MNRIKGALNNNREHLFYSKNQSFFGVGGYCLCVFAKSTSHLFLICYNILYLKVEIYYASLNNNGSLRLSRKAYIKKMHFLCLLLCHQIK